MGTGIIYGCSIICAALAVLGPFLSRPRLTRQPAARTLTTEIPALLLLILAIALAVFLGYRVGTFYIDHWNGFRLGSIRYGAVDELAQYHGILLAACVVAILAIIRQHQRAAGGGRVFAGSAGMATAVLAAVAMLTTLPRSGNEGLMLWIILAPAAGLSMLVLFILSVSLVTRTRKHEPKPVTFGPPLCPTCSYQLTGNLSGICPECGTPVPRHPGLADPVLAVRDVPRRDRRHQAATLAFAAGSASILMCVFGAALPMIRLIPLPGLSTFLIWRVEPWWLGLAMGSALIAAARALPAGKKWAIAVCAAWASGNMSLGVFNIAHAMPMWHRMPPFMFTPTRFLPWLALHVGWSFVLPACLLLMLHASFKKTSLPADDVD